MKFFVDTANIAEIKEAASYGVLDGVTTNPSLVAKEGKEFRSLLKEICSIVPGPVSAEVLATDAQGIVAEGRELAAIAPNIVVKVPLIKEGLKAVKTLSAENIRTNVTLCFSPNQALMAAKAGIVVALAVTFFVFSGYWEKVKDEPPSMRFWNALAYGITMDVIVSTWLPPAVCP